MVFINTDFFLSRVFNNFDLNSSSFVKIFVKIKYKYLIYTILSLLDSINGRHILIKMTGIDVSI